ncbi:hypothetical protein HDU93_001941 [Gonapodya sp. JEL0774]|nr:hypothetical protein HDU93_001941 [Gonapodya sp. JEL0774]
MALARGVTANYWLNSAYPADDQLLQPSQWIPIAVGVVLFALLCLAYFKFRRWRGREKVGPIDQATNPMVQRWRIGAGGWRNAVAEVANRLNAQLEPHDVIARGTVQLVPVVPVATDSAGEPLRGSSSSVRVSFDSAGGPAATIVGPNPRTPIDPQSETVDGGSLVFASLSDRPSLTSTAVDNHGENPNTITNVVLPLQPVPPPAQATEIRRPPSPLVRFQRRNAPHPTFAHATLIVTPPPPRMGATSQVSPELFEAMGGREPRISRGAPAIVVYGQLGR